MGRITKILSSFIFLACSFSALADEVPDELKTMSKAIVDSYLVNDSSEFLAQYHPRLGKAMEEYSKGKVERLFEHKRHDKHEHKWDSIELDTEKSGYKKFDSPMKKRFFPSLDTHFIVRYSLKRHKHGASIFLDYVKEDGKWYLVN
ncbi:MAG: hypothetical protein ACTJIB_05370 [Pseudoalteromonas prydzensis]|uniref:hypothetical protein n=1 Tax=Pseudoalteromonas prydzensis TaxID=182141 RepID=UPI003F9D4DD2